MPNRAMPRTFLRDPRRRSSTRHRLELHAAAGSVRLTGRRTPPFARDGATPGLDTLWLEGLVGVEEDRDRAFIRQLHRHHSLKDAGGHGDTEFAQGFTEYFVKSLGQLRRGGRDEARAPAAACVAVQREL